MPRLQRSILHSLTGKIFLCLLAIAYLGYLFVLARFVGTAVTAPGEVIVEHTLGRAPAAVVKHWTAASMRAARDADQQDGIAFTQGSSDKGTGQAARQRGQPPRSGEASYPLSTVGKVFFSNAAGQDMTCSGTAVASINQSVVDTAGHCLYWNGDWVQN